MKTLKLITIFLLVAMAITFHSCTTTDRSSTTDEDTVYHEPDTDIDTVPVPPVDTIIAVPPVDTVITIPPVDTVKSEPIPVPKPAEPKPKPQPPPKPKSDTVQSTALKPGFGVLSSKVSIAESENIMQQSGVKTQRVVCFYSTNYYSKNADQYIKDGFNVQINFDYKPTSSPVGWCTDTAFIRKQAKAFFAHYKPYIKQIPFVAVENEWDNPLYHIGSIDSYLKELAIVVDEGHKAGFKVTDAAITGNALGRWNYSQLSKDSAIWWKSKYFVGASNDYTNFCNGINYYASKVKSIPIDWINWHWYNNRACSNGLPSALNHWLKATGKSAHLTNEFGVMDAAIWSCTVSEVLGVKPAYAIAYSGVNDPNNAILLTADLLKVLQ